MTLRRWGDVHAGGESCARAGEGVTLEKLGYIWHLFDEALAVEENISTTF